MLSLNDTDRIEIDQSSYTTFKKLSKSNWSISIAKILLFLFLGSIAILFLPWTQNIKVNGATTTLKPEQRPQVIPSVIDGQIQKWYVQEGDFVKKGDTIVFISEIKSDYLDTNLIERTQSQASSKREAIDAYKGKVGAIDDQIKAIEQTLQTKLNQARNKVLQAEDKITIDSSELKAAETNALIAKTQYERYEQLYKEGIKSMADLEQKQLKLQETQNKLQAATNKYNISKNEYLNAKINLETLQAEYLDKISKSQSDQFSALSNIYDAEATFQKLNNQLSNYRIRNQFYYIVAPKDCYITKAIKSGVGEIIKEGTPLVTIMPADYELAAEIYVSPMDLPLLDTGERVRLQFDGWPAFIFSGWENLSTGTFEGKIVAIDRILSDNGKFRILVAPSNKEPWPEVLKIGNGCMAMIMLSDVSVGYEIWRQINGFPAKFYKKKSTPTDSKK